MKDFIQITKDDVLPRLMNGEKVYSFSLTIGKNGNVNPYAKRLNNETIETISSIVNADNVVLFVKKTSK